MNTIDARKELAQDLNESAATLRNADALLWRIQSLEAVPYAAGARALIEQVIDHLDVIAHKLEQERAAPSA